MQLSNSMKFFATVAVAAAAFGGATAAHARSDVSFSIGINAPGPVYVQPEPVYVQPAPVYAPPRVVYAPQPVYVEPAPVYLQPRVVYGPAYYGYGYGYEHRREDWRRAEWQRREWREHHEGRGHH